MADVLSVEKDLTKAQNALLELKFKHAAAVASYRNLIGRDILPKS